MFDKFTDTSRRVVVLAQEQSRELGHGYIGAEHLLLGIASLDSGPAHDALDRCGVRFAALQAATRSLLPPAAKPPGNHVPFTKVAKHILEDSLRRVVALGADEIRPEHLLLSVLNQAMEPDSFVGSLLRGLGVEPESVIEALVSDQDVVRPPSGDSDDRTPGLRGAEALAKRLAGRTKTGTHHLLAAFLADPASAARQILAAGGFDEGRLPTPPTSWDVAGTSDDTPEGRAERALRIDVTDEGVTIRINDPGVVKLLSAADDTGERAPETILAELLGPLFASPAAPTLDERSPTFTIDGAADPEAMQAFIREQLESQGLEVDPETLAKLLEKLRSLRDAPPDDVA
ncbi:MAG: Clp protease N-terminal domain-containing protein [Microthrixaceae bacterium]